MKTSKKTWDGYSSHLLNLVNHICSFHIRERKRIYLFLYDSPQNKSVDDFDLRLNKRWSKQARRWTFETPSRSLVRHYNVLECTLQSINWVDNGAYMCDGHRPYWDRFAVSGFILFLLKSYPLDKMATISQPIFSDVFSWMKILNFD